MFFHHLLPCPSQHCPFGLHYDALSDVDNSPELTGVLRKIHFHNLVDGYAFPDVPYRFLAFFNWVIGEVNSFLLCFFFFEKKKLTSGVLVPKGRARLQRDGFLRDLDTVDIMYSGIDRDAPSFRIEDRHFDDGSHVMTFKAYTNRDLTEITVSARTFAVFTRNTLTYECCWKRVRLTGADSFRLGRHQDRSSSW